MIGYDNYPDNYIVIELATKRIRRTRHVTFRKLQSDVPPGFDIPQLIFPTSPSADHVQAPQDLVTEATLREIENDRQQIKRLTQELEKVRQSSKRARIETCGPSEYNEESDQSAEEPVETPISDTQVSPDELSMEQDLQSSNEDDASTIREMTNDPELTVGERKCDSLVDCEPAEDFGEHPTNADATTQVIPSKPDVDSDEPPSLDESSDDDDESYDEPLNVATDATYIPRPDLIRRFEDIEDWDSPDTFISNLPKRARVNLLRALLTFKNRPERDPDCPTVDEALSGPNRDEWLAAMQAELKSLKDHDVYTVVNKAPNIRTVDHKWVLRLKRHADGSPWKYKARLVCRGFSQRPEEDYDETFAPVISREGLLTMLTIACTRDYEIHNVDVRTAYLNAPIDRDVFMRIPKGFDEGDPRSQYLRLNKALYGLKQSGNLWHGTLHEVLTKLGWSNTIVEPCLYHRKVKRRTQYLLTYVDDIVIATKSKEEMSKAKEEIRSNFDIEDGGELAEVLGIRVTRDRTLKTIYLDQEGKIERYVAEHLPDTRKQRSIPAYANSTPVAHDGIASDEDIKKMRQIVGKVLHISKIHTSRYSLQCRSSWTIRAQSKSTTFRSRRTSTHVPKRYETLEVQNRWKQWSHPIRDD